MLLRTSLPHTAFFDSSAADFVPRCRVPIVPLPVSLSLVLFGRSCLILTLVPFSLLRLRCLGRRKWLCAYRQPHGGRCYSRDRSNPALAVGSSWSEDGPSFPLFSLLLPTAVDERLFG
jgi:hypothetical protein